MNVDIKNIANKKQPFWRSIYKVIKNSYFEETKLFPTTVLNQCTNNQNESQNIPNDIKVSLEKMAMERGLYAQVVMIRRRDSYDEK